MTTPAAASLNAEGDRVYVIVNPATGEPVALPNCSSVLDVVHNFHIPKWKVKMAIVGIARREDLAARAVAASLIPVKVDPKTGKVTDAKARNAALAEIAEDAIDAGQLFEPGKGFLANDKGTAIHFIGELIDEGAVTVDDILNLPASVKEHAQGYLDTIVGHGLEIVSSEATVYSFEHGYAGTLDRFARFTRTNVTDPLWEQYDLGRGTFDIDLKSGANLDAKIAMQLASHVNAEGIYDAETGTYSPLPEDLRRDVGFVLHLRPEGASLVPYELEAAWPAFLGGLAIQRFASTDPKQRPLTAPPMTTGSPLVPGPAQERDGVPATPSRSDHRAPGEGNPPPSPGAEPPSATEDRIPDVDALEAGASPGPSVAEAPQPNQAATEEVGPERVTVTPADPDPTPSTAATDPVHISDPLDELTAQIEQRSALLLFQKHEHLVTHRITPLLATPGGEDMLRRCWPTGVATLAPGNPHTLAELELIAKACDLCDRELRQPFPEPDPTAPAFLTADPAEVAAIVERLQALPKDLLKDVMAALRGKGIPRLTDPTATITVAHLQAVADPLEVVEEEALPRLQKLAEIVDVAAGHEVDEDDLYAVVGKQDPLDLTPADIELLDMVTDACALGVVAFEDLDGFGHVSLVPGPKAWAGMKPSEILAAGRAAAKRLGHDKAPRSAADAMADPLLAVVAAMSLTTAA